MHRSKSSSHNSSIEELKEAFGRLYEIVLLLRAPGGCPWDRVQTPLSLRTNLVEEAYECVSAIEESNDENLKEELGDIFLVAGMIASIKEEEEKFRLTGVLEDISNKLIRRHPHVFGGKAKDTPDEVVEQWNHIKENVEGKKSKKSILERVPRTLPPLERAYLIQEKVSRVGFDWQDVGPVWEKLKEEIEELKEANDTDDPLHREKEFGDLLFTVVNLGRLMHIDPTLALNSTNQKFISRFQQVEERLRARELSPKEADLELMDRLWNQIKEEDQAK